MIETEVTIEEVKALFPGAMAQLLKNLMAGGESFSGARKHIRDDLKFYVTDGSLSLSDTTDRWNNSSAWTGTEWED